MIRVRGEESARRSDPMIKVLHLDTTDCVRAPNLIRRKSREQERGEVTC